MSGGSTCHPACIDALNALEASVRAPHGVPIPTANMRAENGNVTTLASGLNLGDLGDSVDRVEFYVSGPPCSILRQLATASTPACATHGRGATREAWKDRSLLSESGARTTTTSPSLPCRTWRTTRTLGDSRW